MQIENDYDKDVYNGDIGYIDDAIPTEANSPPVSTAALSPTSRVSPFARFVGSWNTDTPLLGSYFIRLLLRMSLNNR